MGNCLALRENNIRVMKTDGEVLEYRAPLKVHQVLLEFGGHAISDTLPVVRHLRPDTELMGGQLYYLLPLPVAKPAVKGGQARGAVRIKVVISKQELEAMLSGGSLSNDDVVSWVLKKQSIISNGVDDKVDQSDACGNDQNCKSWKPALESIPEVN